MTSPLDLVFGEEHASSDRPIVDPAWRILPETTTLFVFMPIEDAPVVRVLHDALQRVLGDEINIGPIDPQAGYEMAWALKIEAENLPHPLIVWSEPAAEVEPGELGVAEAEACRWVIGFETLLDERDPLTHLQRVAHVIERLDPLPAGVLDVNCERCLPWSEFAENLLLPGVEPASDVLWSMHVVERSASDDATASPKPDAALWLHTHGLQRCGRPELEMVDVPSALIEGAVNLMHAVVDLVLDTGVPAPGEAMEIGPRIQIAFQPWQIVARYIADETPGSDAFRAAESDPHTGVRAVICDPSPRGAFRPAWTWPQHVLSSANPEGLTMIYRTERSGNRDRALAQLRFARFVRAFEQRHDAPADVQMIFAVELRADEEAPLWVRVERIDKGTKSLRGRIFAGGEGATTCAFDDVTDWVISTSAGDFRAANVAMLYEICNWQCDDA